MPRRISGLTGEHLLPMSDVITHTYAEDWELHEKEGGGRGLLQMAVVNISVLQ